MGLISAATAYAANYGGVASDGTELLLQTDDKGVPELVHIRNYRADCNHGYTSIRNPITGFEPPFDKATRHRLVDHGRVRVKRHLDGVEGRVHLHIHWNFRATHTQSDRWRGRYGTSGEFRQHHDTITRCAVRFSFLLEPRG